MTQTTYEVIIIGGGAAGLTAALVLGRSRRSVLVVDAGEPRNAPAAGVHNVFTRDGTSPADLLRLGRADAEAYGAMFRSAAVVGAEPLADGFAVTLDDGATIHGRRLLVTTGLVDDLPEVPGLRERWGTDVVHCPYCHGWEIRDRHIGVLGTGPMAVHQALLFSQWSRDVTLFLHTAPDPADDELEQLAAREIAVVTGRVVSLESVDDALAGLVLDDGSRHPIGALAVAPRFAARAGFLDGLGLRAAEHPMGTGTFVAADERGATLVPGVWAAGNVTDPYGSVISAAADGLKAGAMINFDLIMDDVQRTRAAS